MKFLYLSDLIHSHAQKIDSKIKYYEHMFHKYHINYQNKSSHLSVSKINHKNIILAQANFTMNIN